VLSLDQKRKRAERFKIPVVQSEDEKKKLRSQKFGVVAEKDKKQQRAARFGTGVVTTDEKKAARQKKFGITTSLDESQKLKNRALKYGLSNERSSAMGRLGLPVKKDAGTPEEQAKLDARAKRFVTEA